METKQQHDELAIAQRGLPYLTQELAGIGGIAKHSPDDFEVEEIPAYTPSGTGDHLFLWVEKRGLDAQGLLSHLGRTLGVPVREIGCAGLKDAQAITRQFVSVPAKCESRLPAVESEQVRVLSAARHGNKLKTGHLKGNRFRILVRQVVPAAEARAQAIVTRLAEAGVPNYFGPQRFGREESTLRLGLEILSGNNKRTSGFMLRLALSAVQSALFNLYLRDRLLGGTLSRVLPGEVMQVVASGGPFVAEDLAREQARFLAHEIVMSGPIFGPKMRAPMGEAAVAEEQLLAEYGLAVASFARFSRLLRGTRRPLLIWPGELSATGHAEGIELRMTLPKGSYASVVLREIMKTDLGALDEADDDE